MTAAKRIAELRSKAESRMSPQMGPMQRENPNSLNSPFRYNLIAVPDPDTDTIWLCDRLERAEQLLIEHQELLGKSLPMIESVRPLVMSETSKFLAGEDE